MKYRIKRIQPGTAASTLALAYGVVVTAWITILALASEEWDAGKALGTILAWAAGCVVSTLLWCWLYNMAVRWSGGIAVELDADPGVDA